MQHGFGHLSALTTLDVYSSELIPMLENPNIDLNDPTTWELLGSGRATRAGVRVTHKKALGYPPLWRAYNLISGDVGRLPLSRYLRLPDGGKIVDRKGISHRLLRRRANPYIRSSTLKRTLTYHALSRGNGFAWIQRDKANRPLKDGMIVLDPDTTRLLSVDGALWYVVEINGEDRLLPAEDVFHIKGLSHNGLWGIDVHDLMKESLGLPIAAREFTASFFGSGSNQSGVLMVPGSFPEDKVKNTLKMWNEMAVGLAQSHKVALLKDGVKFVPTSAKPRESMTHELLQHEVLMVSAITGCPPHKLGDSSRTSYNSLESENQSYLDDCLETWLTEFEEEADTKLLTEQEQEDETVFHEFNRNARLRSDAQTRASVYKIYREIGVFTANDVCRRENLPTIGAEGDVRYVPSNWTAVGRAAPASTKQAQKSLRRLAADIVDKRLAIEREKVSKAASREDFANWLVSFYSEHKEHLCSALRPVVHAVADIAGRRPSLNKSVGRMLAAHLDDIRQAADPEAVQEAARQWTSEQLLQDLFSKERRCEGSSSTKQPQKS